MHNVLQLKNKQSQFLLANHLDANGTWPLLMDQSDVTVLCVLQSILWIGTWLILNITYIATMNKSKTYQPMEVFASYKTLLFTFNEYLCG